VEDFREKIEVLQGWKRGVNRREVKGKIEKVGKTPNSLIVEQSNSLSLYSG